MFPVISSTDPGRLFHTCVPPIDIDPPVHATVVPLSTRRSRTAFPPVVDSVTTDPSANTVPPFPDIVPAFHVKVPENVVVPSPVSVPPVPRVKEVRSPKVPVRETSRVPLDATDIVWVPLAPPAVRSRHTAAVLTVTV